MSNRPVKLELSIGEAIALDTLAGSWNGDPDVLTALLGAPATQAAGLRACIRLQGAINAVRGYTRQARAREWREKRKNGLAP